MSMRAEVVVASNRAAAGSTDTTGPLIVDFLQDRLRGRRPVVVPDGDRRCRDPRRRRRGARVVLTTGGTGLTPTDPHPGRPALLDRGVPGIAEAIRAYGVAQGVPTAVLSRGSPAWSAPAWWSTCRGRAGSEDGLAVLRPVLVHAAEQVLGATAP